MKHRRWLPPNHWRGRLGTIYGPPETIDRMRVFWRDNCWQWHFKERGSSSYCRLGPVAHYDSPRKAADAAIQVAIATSVF